MNMKAIMDYMKRTRGKKLFPVHCKDCDTTIHDLEEATAHYKRCIATQQMTQTELAKDKKWQSMVRGR